MNYFAPTGSRINYTFVYMYYGDIWGGDIYVIGRKGSHRHCICNDGQTLHVMCLFVQIDSEVDSENTGI